MSVNIILIFCFFIYKVDIHAKLFIKFNFKIKSANEQHVRSSSQKNLSM